MKTKIAAAILFAAFLSAAPRPAEASVSVSISFFHQELEPYGRWVYTPAYGEVWYPTVVRAGWAPYVDGEWVYTDCGWTWVSYDPFSDPFHYGTWVWVDPYGWAWEPGYVWGPAWVTWAWTDTYVGWAPLPATFAITAVGYSGGPVSVPASRYVFAPINQFAGTNISTVRVAPAETPTILARAQRTTRYSVSNGFVRTSGPPTALVERATGRSVRAVSVSSVKVRPATISAAHGGRLSIVAPAHERAAAMKQSQAVKRDSSTIARHETKTSKAVSPQVAGTHVSKGTTHTPKGTETAHIAKTDKHAAPAAVSERHEVKPVHQKAKGSGGPPPMKSVEKRHEAASPAPPKIHEEHRAAMNRPAPQPHPARAEGPPPHVEQPHPGAPPAAAAKPPEHPQPQGQGKGPKKEKQQR